MLVVGAGAGQAPPALPNAMVYRVNSGMPGPASLIFQPLTAFADLPPISLASGTILKDSIYVIEPEMSHVSRAFAEQDQSPWMKAPGQ
jgi:hypothetical protein